MPISGLDVDSPNINVIHAGTKEENNAIVSNGGRVLGVVSKASTLDEAISTAYAHIPHIQFDSMYYRSDIGKKASRYTQTS